MASWDFAEILAAAAAEVARQEAWLLAGLGAVGAALLMGAA